MCIRDRVNRGYKELVEKLDIERVSDIKYLPWDVISTVVNDDNVVDNEHLPGDETGAVADDNNDDVIENGVSEIDTLNNNSDEESLMGVEVRDEVLVADEIERVCKESLSAVSYTHLDVYKRQEQYIN